MCRYNGGEGFVPGAMFKKFDKRQGTVYVKKVCMLMMIINVRYNFKIYDLVSPIFRYRETLPTDVALKLCLHLSQTGEHSH